MIAFAVGAAGMQAAAHRLETSALALSRAGGLDDAAGAVVEQIGAQIQFEASAAVVRTAADMTGTLLDVLA